MAAAPGPAAAAFVVGTTPRVLKSPPTTTAMLSRGQPPLATASSCVVRGARVAHSCGSDLDQHSGSRSTIHTHTRTTHARVVRTRSAHLVTLPAVLSILRRSLVKNTGDAPPNKGADLFHLRAAYGGFLRVLRLLAAPPAGLQVSREDVQQTPLAEVYSRAPATPLAEEASSPEAACALKRWGDARAQNR